MYTVEWYNKKSNVGTNESEFETLEEARDFFEGECWRLEASCKRDQEKYDILLGEVDENGDYMDIDSFSI